MPAHFTPGDQTHWMAQALELSSNALPTDVPVGCLILRYNQDQWAMVAQTVNTREQEQDPTGHAEINALRQAAQALGRWRLEDCILVVTLEPCPMCASAIIQSRLSEVVFGAFDPLAGALGSRYTLHHQSSKPLRVTGGVMEAACAQALHDFFNTQRNNNPPA